VAVLFGVLMTLFRGWWRYLHQAL